jgi:hypothetical protein
MPTLSPTPSSQSGSTSARPSRCSVSTEGLATCAAQSADWAGARTRSADLLGAIQALPYRETGSVGGSKRPTIQYTLASAIKATELGCAVATAVVRRYLTTWRSDNTLPRRIKRFHCSYERSGSDIGTGNCDRGQYAEVTFDLYDSSPFH